MTTAAVNVKYPGAMSLWKHELQSRYFQAELAMTVILLCLVARVSSQWLVFMEINRTGVSLPDPILTSFQPMNLKWPIFILLWTAVIGTILHLLYHPRFLVIGLQAAGLLLTFRTISITIMPLEPLGSIIPLTDPIIEGLGTGKPIVKDLFFSGHTAIVFLCAVAARNIPWKILCALSAVAVGSGVILQHVHYSADVYSAPFFAYTSWRLALLAHQKLRTE